jgi:hypothetical protein
MDKRVNVARPAEVSPNLITIKFSFTIPTSPLLIEIANGIEDGN